MTKTPGAFWFDLIVKHPNFDPSSVSDRLGIKPYFQASVGAEVGPLVRKYSVWMGRISQSNEREFFLDHYDALTKLFAKESKFLRSVFEEQGVIELNINQVVTTNEGLISSITLGPELLELCGQCGISITTQAWSEEHVE